MTKLFGLILSGLVLLGGGAGIGWAAARHVDKQYVQEAVQDFIRTDPLRQDSPSMEQWFQANIQGDTEAMYQLSSPDLQKQMGHDEFIAEFKHDPTPPGDAPKITFTASVKLAGYGSELFYDVAFDTGQGVKHATIAVYVDDDGKFETFAA